MIPVKNTDHKQRHYNKTAIKEREQILHDMIGKKNSFNSSNLVTCDEDKRNFSPVLLRILKRYFNDDLYKVINFQNPTTFDDEKVIKGMLLNRYMTFPEERKKPNPRDGSTHKKYNATTHEELAGKNTIVCINNEPKLMLLRNVLSEQEQNGLKSLSDLHIKKEPKEVTDKVCKASGLPDEDKIRSAIKKPDFDVNFGSKGCTVDSVTICGE